MDWTNILIGVCLIILGFLWFLYEIDDTIDYQKEKSFGQLSTQPSQYLGIFILVAIGITMIFRAI